MNNRRRARALPIAVATVLLGAAACSDDDGDRALVDSRSANPPADETTEVPEASSDTETADQDQGSDGGRGALGSGTGELPDFDTGAPVALRIEVTRLERNGDHVELGMTLTNEDDELDFEPVDAFKDPEFATQNVYDLSGVRLIDQGERKAYLPVIDSGGFCLCTGNLFNVSVLPGDTFGLEATFGGIPSSASTLDLDMPGFSTIAGLAVEG